MYSFRARQVAAKLFAFVLLVFGTNAMCASESAQEVFSTERLTLVFGPYVRHMHGGEHNDTPYLTGLEWEPTGSPVEYGAVYFKNSFYQDCLYVYVGKRWFAAETKQGLYLNLSGGPLYGYRDEYEKKIPFNHNGLGLAIIPAIGYQYHRVNAQLVILGTAGLMATFGYDFPR